MQCCSNLVVMIGFSCDCRWHCCIQSKALQCNRKINHQFLVLCIVENNSNV